MKIIKKLYLIIYWIFITAILLITVLLVISIFPITGNIKFLTVLSGSMEPSIKTGSIVIVKPASDYKAGEVITFGPNTKTKPPTTHRITTVNEENGQVSYITKGDANNAPDIQPVMKKNVIGKVFLNVPYVGYLINAARKPYGFMLIIILPAILIIYDEIQKIWQEIKKRKEKKENSI